ncbi:MAG: DNA-3-methyladenine glycosylase 2 family protein [Acidimicrobiia bacterium]|nr:DNA-3-methyladenine glycosylase 2 family protein [Acidimicrobiia bacterium]
MIDVRLRKVVSHLKASDPRLGAVIARVGAYKQQFSEPGFASLARCIVYQQLNGNAAATIHRRLHDACKGPLTPDAILKLRPARMRAAGLSGQKLNYIRDLARQTRSGALDFRSIHDLSDDGVIAMLTQVKGIGVWTAHMFLMFSLRRPDVLPVGDYGIRAAIKKLYGLEELPKPAEMESIAEPWRPYRSVASWYLWRSLEVEVTL